MFSVLIVNSGEVIQASIQLLFLSLQCTMEYYYLKIYLFNFVYLSMWGNFHLSAIPNIPETCVPLRAGSDMQLGAI